MSGASRLARARRGPLAWAIARAELASGLGALRLLVACLFLGAFALSGVGSLERAILNGLAERGAEILGADVEARLTQRMPTAAERAALEAEGRLSNTIRLRAMMRSARGERLVELKAMDGQWPLYGEARLVGGGGNAEARAALARPDAVLVEPALADELDLAIGSIVELGQARFRVAGLIAHEPDRASEGFQLGPSALIGLEGLRRTGLIQPGTLYRHHSRLALPPGVAPAEVVRRLDERFPQATWRLVDRSDGAPGVRRLVERLAQFLTLVSLTALTVAGVGVANGVRSYFDARVASIATLKTLGADSAFVIRTYGLALALVALGSALAGALVGLGVPRLVAWLAADVLPVPPSLALDLRPPLVAVLFAMLVATAAAASPLARAGALPAQRLFRAGSEPWPWASRRALGLAAAAGLLVAALAVLVSVERLIALGFLGAAAAVVVLLWLVGAGVEALARRLPRPRSTLARLAIANLHRPGARTRQVVLALGLGLTLFATLALVESSLSGELRRTVPERAPGYFVIDIPRNEAAAFRAALPPGSEVRMVPSLRGPITRLRGVPVHEIEAPPSGAWVLQGDRGLTFSAEVPEGNELVAGAWWPPDYAGPPLVSFDAEQAALLGLRVGDSVGVSVLGLELEARIANLRRIDWQSFGFNFSLVFDPATLADAPYSWMATVTPPPGADAGLARRLGAVVPTASVVRVADVLEEVATLIGQMGTAVRWAASVAVLAGIAVLIGAIAAQARARTYEGIVLKTMGATRGQLLAAAALEYALLGLAVGLVALAIGTLAAWAVVVHVLDLGWNPDWVVAALVVVAGGIVTLALGLVGTARALGRPVAAGLRSA